MTPPFEAFLAGFCLGILVCGALLVAVSIGSRVGGR